MSSKKVAAKAAVAAPAAAKAVAPSPVDAAQVKSALLALYSHISSSSSAAQSKQLLEDEEDIYLVLAMKKTPLKQHNKPIRISIPNSIYDPATTPGAEICLFTKDPPQPKDYDIKSGIPLVNPIKVALQTTPVAGVTKVLSISKLRKNYKQFGDRRRLLSSYTLFLTDARIMSLLPPLLGVKFYEKKKQPVAVNLDQFDIAKEIQRARDSTYLFINTGACSNVRISRSSFSRQQSFENIQAALTQIAEHIPKKWAGVQSIHIKTQNSIALPIYNSGHSIDQLVEDPKPTPAQKKKAASLKKKLNKKRALSTKKEAASSSSADVTPANSNKKQKTTAAAAPAADAASSKKKKTVAAPAAAAAAPSVTPAASATPAKSKPSAKRARDEPSTSSAAAVSSPAPVAPSAKKAKSAAAAAPASPAAAASTPVKAASKKGAAAKSAVKAEATPKASQKKAASTASKKK